MSKNAPSDSGTTSDAGAASATDATSATGATSASGTASGAEKAPDTAASTTGTTSSTGDANDAATPTTETPASSQGAPKHAARPAHRGAKIAKRIGIAVAIVIACLVAIMVLVPLTETGDTATVAGSQDWMAALDDDTPLNEVVLPGTHDSGTQYVQMAFFAKTQTESIGDQLDDGFRYLDIRLGADGDQLQLMHGFTTCQSSQFGSTLYLDEVLEQCYAFLEEHPTETIVFCVKQEHGSESVAEFEQLLDSYIQQNPDAWLLTDQMPTVGEARGHIVLVRRYADEAGLGAQSGIPMVWDGQKASDGADKDVEAVDQGSYTLWVQDRYEYGVDDKWQAFVDGMAAGSTEDGDVTLSFLSTKGTLTYGHPYLYAMQLNERLLAQTDSSDLRGWVVVDYASAPLAQHIYAANFVS